jgi:calcium-dependent protein kinase
LLLPDLTLRSFFLYDSLDIKPENLLLRRIPRQETSAKKSSEEQPTNSSKRTTAQQKRRQSRLDDTNSDEVVALADFGLAVYSEDETFHLLVGTPAYWAPEMVRREPFGLSVDMWALGCVLYILLCGVHPFDPTGEAPEAQILARVASGQYDKSNKEYTMLSSAAKDLLRHLLDPDPARRYTAKRALEHPWLTTEMSRDPLTSDHVAKLSGYRVLVLIKTGMRDMLRQAEADLFDRLDENGDGYISREELTKGLQAVGFDLSEAEIDAFLKLVDTDGDELISKAEFAEVLAKRFDKDTAPPVAEHASLEDLAILFKALDKDSDGYVNADDVYHVLTLLGSTATKSLVQAEWSQVTEDESGLVSFADFVKYVRKGEGQKRRREDGVAGTSSILKLRDKRDLLRSRR